MTRSFEDQLALEGYLIKQTKGVSMEPMLRQYREESVICPVDREIRKYDVVLFRRKDGQYVLHRVVGMEGDIYLIRGDNCVGTERVLRQQIIGILKGFYRGETYVDCTTDRAYLRYSHRIVRTFPLRRGKLRAKSLCKALLKKLHIKSSGKG